MTNDTGDPAEPNVLLKRSITPDAWPGSMRFPSNRPCLQKPRLLHQWGRIGTGGRQMIELHASPVVAQIELQRWIGRKLRRGYIARA